MVKKVLKCVPREYHNRGRPRRGWKYDIKGAVEERDIAEEDLRKERVVTGGEGGRETATAVK
jgi:hypothetical protein